MSEKIIYPEYVENMDIRCLNIDNTYISSIKIYEFPKFSSFLEVIRNIDSIRSVSDFDMGIYIEKLDSKEVLKNLTYSIAVSKSEKNTTSKNQIDVDVLNTMEENAKNIRYEIQVNNEEVYKVNIVISIYKKRDGVLNTKLEILNKLKDIESMLYSKGIYSNYMNFRQLESYVATLPLMSIPEVLTSNNYIFTNTSLAGLFPFFTDGVFDENGVLLGYDSSSNNIYNIDIFNERYMNANVCVFGSSGSGKSYFTKLNIIRNFFNRVDQIVFDIEGEYVSLASSLGAETIIVGENKKFINILEFSEQIVNENFFEMKIESDIKIIEEMLRYINFESFFENTIKTKEYTNILRESLMLSYKKYNINSSKESIYKSNNYSQILLNKKIKSGIHIPCILDVLNEMKNLGKYNSVMEEAEKIESVLKKELYIFLKHTNIELGSKLIVIDFSKIANSNYLIISKILLNQINSNILNNKNTIIYFDEVWKYMNLSQKEKSLQEEIYTMYKTIRKKKASIFTVTQDIYDFFKFDDGNYGKSIINNSAFKVFFKINFTDIEFLEKLGVIKGEVVNKIKYLNKGQALLMFNNSYIKINIKSNDIEDIIITNKKIDK